MNAPSETSEAVAMTWQDETCETCRYRRGDHCRRGPALERVAFLTANDDADDREHADACAEHAPTAQAAPNYSDQPAPVSLKNENPDLHEANSELRRAVHSCIDISQSDRSYAALIRRNGTSGQPARAMIVAAFEVPADFDDCRMSDDFRRIVNEFVAQRWREYAPPD